MFLYVNTATGVLVSAFWENARNNNNEGYLMNVLHECTLFASDRSLILGA